MKKILIVSANYYEDINFSLIKFSKNYLKIKKIKCNLIKASGVLEIPVTISKYINKYDGFIALGCVIKGKTPHFDLICSATFNGLMNLSIKNKKPIGNGIITAHNKKQAVERINSKSKEACNALLTFFENVPE